jgi:hypothetical protein
VKLLASVILSSLEVIYEGVVAESYLLGLAFQSKEGLKQASYTLK